MSRHGRGRRGGTWKLLAVIALAFLAIKACSYSNATTQLQHNLPPGYHVVGAH
jgi:hypothetical protein